MIEEKATVVAIDRNQVTVTSDVKSACSGCQQVDSCGSGQVAKAFPQKKLSLTLITDLPVKLGDVVVIALNESQLLRAAWQVYIWPLIGLLLGAWFGEYLLSNQIIAHELIAIVIAGMSGYCGFLMAKWQQQKAQHCAHLAPQILRIEKHATIAIDRA